VTVPPGRSLAMPVVLAAVRTPVGRHAGALSHVRPDDLAAITVREALARSGVSPSDVDEVMLGIVNASGEAMGNVARFAALLAGIPPTAAGLSMNRFCGSGLSAVNALAHSIAFGAVRAGVAGGVETMSRSTWPILKLANPRYVGPLVARDAIWSGAGGPQHPSLEADGTMIDMPEGAQVVATELGISRAEADAWAARSHARAAAAWAEGRFADEVVPVPGPKPSDPPVTIDETVRADTTLERLAGLRPYHPAAPDITAGNASPINDGSSAVVLADEAWARSAGLAPMARVIATSAVGIDAAHFALGPVPAIRRLLDGAGLGLDDIDLFEINEAFAAQVIACVRTLGLDEARVNVNGGAVALGHALGNSGSRITVTLLHELARRGGRFGVAALCVGGGQGIATLFERV
jgi:acetyl-CoA C-acetyltransferase